MQFNNLIFILLCNAFIYRAVEAPFTTTKVLIQNIDEHRTVNLHKNRTQEHYYDKYHIFLSKSSEIGGESFFNFTTKQIQSYTIDKHTKDVDYKVYLRKLKLFLENQFQVEKDFFENKTNCFNKIGNFQAYLNCSLLLYQKCNSSANFLFGPLKSVTENTVFTQISQTEFEQYKNNHTNLTEYEKYLVGEVNKFDENADKLTFSDAIRKMFYYYGKYKLSLFNIFSGGDNKTSRDVENYERKLHKQQLLHKYLKRMILGFLMSLHKSYKHIYTNTKFKFEKIKPIYDRDFKEAKEIPAFNSFLDVLYNKSKIGISRDEFMSTVALLWPEISEEFKEVVFTEQNLSKKQINKGWNNIIIPLN